MTSYLLLRSNKETGPHSFDQLLGFGLKPYDLVWVNGKSAAWRYPSEIEELRAYVPGDVEQPFDRFFKKPTETNLPLFPEQSVPSVPQIVREPTPEPPAPVVKDLTPTPAPPQMKTEPKEEKQYAPKEFSEYEQQYLPRKSVYVTMPERKNDRSPQTEQPVAQPRPQQNIPVPAPIPTYTDETPTISITENPDAPKIKYSQPLDEIKEMYVKTLQQRKDKIARKAFFKINLKRVAAVVGLIGFGLLAGYIMKTGKNSINPNTLAVTNNALPAQNIPDKSSEPAIEPVINPSQEQANIQLPTEEPNSARPLASNQLPAPKMDRPNSRIQEKPISKQGNDQQLFDSEKVDYSPSSTNEQTGERSRSVRSEIPEAKTPATKTSIDQPQKDVSQKKVIRNSTRNALGKQVVVTTNDYKRVAFGGIRNLELTVTNNSKYELDNVLVELEYIKPNEEILKTDTYRFTGVAASEAATIRIPDTNRGIRVEYRIVSIGSRQFNADVAAQ